MPRAPKAPAAVQPAAAGPSGGGAALVNQGKAQQPPKKQQRKAAAGAAAATAAAVAAQQGGPFGAASGQLHTSGHAQSGSQQQAVSNAPADPAELERRIQHTRKQLADVEKQIYNLEAQYFENANPQGNAIRGYEGLLSSAPISVKKAAFKPEDRIFSSSSVTGHAHMTSASARGGGAGGGGGGGGAGGRGAAAWE